MATKVKAKLKKKNLKKKKLGVGELNRKLFVYLNNIFHVTCNFGELHIT